MDYFYPSQNQLPEKGDLLIYLIDKNGLIDLNESHPSNF